MYGPAFYSQTKEWRKPPYLNYSNRHLGPARPSQFGGKQVANTLFFNTENKKNLKTDAHFFEIFIKVISKSGFWKNVDCKNIY